MTHIIKKLPHSIKPFFAIKAFLSPQIYVLAETITLLRARTDPDGLNVFIDTIFEEVKEGKIVLERIDERRWEKAWNLSKKYSDKPYISFFDFSSFVVMKEKGISDALTADSHFEEIGLGFKKLF